VLLQPLDDGRLTDGQGRTVDFRNVVLIMTSNLGSSYTTDLTLAREERRVGALGAVRQAFKPELLNRLGDILVFEALTPADLVGIVERQVGLLQARVADRRLTLDATAAAREWLAGNGFDPACGARPLRRLVRTAVGDPLARALLGGEVIEGRTVVVDVVDGALRVTPRAVQPGVAVGQARHEEVGR